MQAQGNFFYDFDFFVDLIASIATGGEKSFCQNCNLLLSCLDDYKKSNEKSAFAKYLEKNIKYKELNSIEDCAVFIDALKRIPLTYIGWSDRERNMLDLITIPKQRKLLKSSPNSSLNMSNIKNKRKKTYDSSENSLAKPPNLTAADKQTVRGLPNIGLSCYMNSALQSLYHDRHFRDRVMKCNPSGENEEKMKAVKEIFQYLSGKQEMSPARLESLQKTIGHRLWKEESADAWRWAIHDWFGSPDEEVSVSYIMNEGSLVNQIAAGFKTFSRNVYTLPNTVNVTIERLGYDVEFSTENKNKRAKYREKRLNFNINMPSVFTYNDATYELKFSIVHHAPAAHYISYYKNGKMWNKINDSYVSTCRWDAIKDDIGRNSTFLRYEKIK